MEMYDFFYGELKTVKALTGILQWEKLNEQPDPGKAIDDVISPMIEETKRDPFKILKPIVIQQVIHEAILTDQEFIGLNAKFIRRALNTWWGIHGDRVLMARDDKGPEFHKPVELTPEQDAKVNVLLSSYRARLLSHPMPQLSKKEIKQEGAEWKSELERKAVSTEIDPDRKPYTAETIAERNKRIRKMQEQAFRSRNPEATEEEVQLFMHQASRYEVPEPKSKGEMKK